MDKETLGSLDPATMTASIETTEVWRAVRAFQAQQEARAEEIRDAANRAWLDALVHEAGPRVKKMPKGPFASVDEEVYEGEVW